ncbi:30S ribosomal protein S16 [Candidatus Curtissbacteria bacterium]|nr:30S ribosomal protein S16 [Candidatus Curtissbacteria bacterium]
MVKIRLARVGKSHQISYRIVATDERSKRDGRFLELLGFYNSHNKPMLQLDSEKLAAWIQKGAKPTPAVENLLALGHLVKKTPKRKAKQESPKTKEATKPAEKTTEEQSQPQPEPKTLKPIVETR